MSSVSNRPLFARAYVRLTEGNEQDEHRSRLSEGLSGRVVEVGSGHGLNFPFYGHAGVSVVAVEPERYLRARAAEAATRTEVPVRVVAGVADALPLPGASCDAAVASLVLCSFNRPDAALAEMRRVVRPGGVLRFYEHVVAPKLGFASVQRAVDVVWPYVAGGCHASRDTVSAIERAGFRIEHIERFDFMPSWVAWPVRPHVLGEAVRLP